MSIKPKRIAVLHPEALRVVEHYLNLHIGGKSVVAPYFMNSPGRKGRRVSVGKGTAAALERETARLAKKYAFDLESATPQQIREFMIQHKLGIDCSGLVAWASHALALQHASRPLWRGIRFTGNPLRAHIKKYLRPIENMSARLLTSEANAHTIHDLRDVRAGDIVRTLNGGHVLLVTEVGYDKHDNPTHFVYINSTIYDDIPYGVRYGLINVVDPSGHILQQQWIDGENGVNWVFNAASKFPNDTRVVRLNMLADKHG